MAGSLTGPGVRYRSVSGAQQSACLKAGQPFPAIPPDAFSWPQPSLPPELREGGGWAPAWAPQFPARPSGQKLMWKERGDKALTKRGALQQVLLRALRSHSLGQTPHPRAARWW